MSATGNKLLSCFEGLVAIDGTCGEASPSSGIFLKKLGVTRSELSQYLTKEYTSPDQLFKDKYDAAVLNIVNAVHSYFAPKYKAATILEGRRAGIFQNNLQQVAGVSGTMKGIAFRIDNRDSFLDLNLPSLSIQLNYTGEVAIQIIDLIQGIKIDEVKIDALPNEIITTQINKIIPSDRKFLNCFIGYDSSGITSVKTDLQLSSGCSGCDMSVITNSYLNVRAATIGVSQQKIDSNLVSAQDTGGLSLMYSLSCNHRQWICSVSNTLALAIAYETCGGLMEHAKYQGGKEQVNIRVGSENVKEEVEERRAMYERKAADIMNRILNNMTLPSDEKCFACRQINRTAVLIP